MKEEDIPPEAIEDFDVVVLSLDADPEIGISAVVRGSRYRFGFAMKVPTKVRVGSRIVGKAARMEKDGKVILVPFGPMKVFSGKLRI